MESKERFSLIEDEDDREPVEMGSLIREKEGGGREIKIVLRHINDGGLVPAEGWDSDSPRAAYIAPYKTKIEPLTFSSPIKVWEWLKTNESLFRCVWPEPSEKEQAASPEQLLLLEIQ